MELQAAERLIFCRSVTNMLQFLAIRREGGISTMPGALFIGIAKTDVLLTINERKQKMPVIKFEFLVMKMNSKIMYEN